VFDKNSAARGGAVYVTATVNSANVTIPVTNCTIANNNGIAETGGIYVTRTGTPVVDVDLINTILWNNTDASGTLSKKQAYLSGGATGSINNSLIQDGMPSGYADSGFNVFTDPLFKKANDVDGADNIFATADDGFSLKPASPAVNAGVTVPVSSDITGLPRPQGIAYDMGAYEKPGAGCSLPDVTGLIVSTITSCSLKYTWTVVPAATGYQVEYKQTSSGTWISPDDIGAITEKTITGLTANTAYDFRIRAKSGSECTGNWTQLLNSLTYQYDIPLNPAEKKITSSSATLHWKIPACGPAPRNYTIRFKPASSSEWTTSVTADTLYNAAGLTASTKYNWKVRANYKGGSSEYTSLQKFTTHAVSIAVTNQLNQIYSRTEAEDISLQQNIPNPFKNVTVIHYTLPDIFGTAKFIFTDISGNVLKTANIKNSGKGSFSFYASALPSGTYQYSLFIDGKLIGTKKMMLAK
jgi:predicted outer membrane repeat protein